MNKLVFILCFLLIGIPSIAQKQNILTSDSVNLFLTIKGKGTPCLYIHGGPGSGSHWMEKFSGDILEKRFQMIYLDLRGVGRSASPANGNYTMDRMIRDFEEIRKKLGISQWLIMGHSFSGTMVTEYAYRHPAAIKGMMMFNCTLNLQESITQSWIPKACEFMGLQDDAFFRNANIGMSDKLQRIFPLLNEKGLMWKLAFAKEENERKMNETFSEIPNWNHAFSGIGISHPDYQKNFKSLTPAIKAPVLFFYGTSDWSVGPDHYKGVQFPNLLLWESEVGHIPFMENKADLERAMDKFVKKYDLGS